MLFAQNSASSLKYSIKERKTNTLAYLQKVRKKLIPTLCQFFFLKLLIRFRISIESRERETQNTKALDISTESPGSKNTSCAIAASTVNFVILSGTETASSPSKTDHGNTFKSLLTFNYFLQKISEKRQVPIAQKNESKLTSYLQNCFEGNSKLGIFQNEFNFSSFYFYNIACIYSI